MSIIEDRLDKLGYFVMKDRQSGGKETHRHREPASTHHVLGFYSCANHDASDFKKENRYTLFSLQKKEILAPATIWMNRKDTILK